MGKRIRKIHFTGIKGVGMAPLAIIAKEAGFKVTGSDIPDVFITDLALKKAKIPVFSSFSEDHVKGAHLVITTGAHGGLDNKEVVYALSQKIPVWTHGQALGEFMKGEILKRKFEGISVAGSHGKTTTTAMLATLFSSLGLDPTYLVGTGNISPLSMPGHLGKGKYFICEADEYATEPKHDKTPRFMWQYPKIGVFTNLELDHPDLYPTVESVSKAFLDFSKNISPTGFLVLCEDNDELRNLKKEIEVRVVTYGYSPKSDYVLKNVSVKDGQTFFWVSSKGTSLGSFAINVFGEHNALNALATIVVALESGLSLELTRKGICNFRGSKRRMEYLGTTENEAMIFDDYAHHPTEIASTLKAFRQAYPKKKIICIFQPHTYSRTKTLFKDFSSAFSLADGVGIVDIYPSLREEPDLSINSSLLTESIKTRHKNAFYIGSVPQAQSYVQKQAFNRNTIIITMGAGDIYTIWQHLKLQNEPIA